MKYMLSGYCCLELIDISNFDTSALEDMIHMFEGCTLLRAFNLSNFITVKVKYMNYIFLGCSLESIDLSEFDTLV
jgi:surface protein